MADTDTNLEVVDVLKEILALKARDSTHRLMMSTGALSSARLLFEHFKTGEALKQAGLAGQLKFLLSGGPSMPPRIRAYLALGWMDRNIKTIEDNPNSELDQMFWRVIDSALDADIPLILPHAKQHVALNGSL